MSGRAAIVAQGLWAGYDGLAAVRGLDLEVREGEVVALLGPNGAGKTTTLLTLAGAMRPIRGNVRWFGEPARGRVHERVKKGMRLVPEHRSIVSRLTVRDNLLLGPGGLSAVTIFPELSALLRRPAGLLSGGEQQMLTLARALAAKPKALLVDELSLGLAPLVVNRLFEAVTAAAHDDGVAVMLVEQQARRALKIADRWYLLRQGEVSDSGDRAAASESADWDARFLYGNTPQGGTYAAQ